MSSTGTPSSSARDRSSPRNGRPAKEKAGKPLKKAGDFKKKGKRKSSKDSPESSKDSGPREPGPPLDPEVEAAQRLQRRWRALRAQGKAREGMQLLREWDVLLEQVRHECSLRRAAVRIQCAVRRRLARKALRDRAATRLQCAVRQKLARRALHDAYWAYAFGLLKEDASLKLGRWWRTLRAKWAARADLQLLREWDAFRAQLDAVMVHRIAAARRLQEGWRNYTARKWIASMRGKGRRESEGATSQANGWGRGLESELNPFSNQSVGPQEHRRRVEAREGKLKQFGTISVHAMLRALPSQIATLFNTLRFVDAINALLERHLVETNDEADGARSASYESLMAWGDKALQARFSGSTQYLKAARHYGLLHFRGEILHEGSRDGRKVTSHSLGCSRKALLERAMLLPQRILPAIANCHPRVRDTVVRHMIFQSSYAEQTNEFFGGSVEKDWGDLLDADQIATRRAAPPSAPQPRVGKLDNGAQEWWPDDDEHANDETAGAREEAEACARRAHKKLGEGDSEAALRLVKRSLKLAETEIGRQLELRVQDRLNDEAAVRRVLEAYDLFEVLALSRECSAADVKRSFIKLSKTLHPDKNGAAQAANAFDRLRSAQMTLSDAQARQEYANKHPPRGRGTRDWAQAMERGERNGGEVKPFRRW